MMVKINESTPGGYQGAHWIQRNFKVPMSEIGVRVADLLGDLFFGIYHLDSDKLKQVEWDNSYHIEFALGWKTLSTFDNDGLTRLVYLAHDRAVRVDVQPRANKYLTLIFHPRERSPENYFKHHPTLEEAIEKIDKLYKP